MNKLLPILALVPLLVLLAVPWFVKLDDEEFVLIGRCFSAVSYLAIAIASFLWGVDKLVN